MDTKRGASLGEKNSRLRVSLKSTNFVCVPSYLVCVSTNTSDTFLLVLRSINLALNLDYVPGRVDNSNPFRNALDPFQASNSRRLLIVFHQFARLVNTRR